MTHAMHKLLAQQREAELRRKPNREVAGIRLLLDLERELEAHHRRRGRVLASLIAVPARYGRGA